MKEQRNNGAIGALLDEYEKAIVELQDAISELSSEELITIVDEETNDSSCKSIQTILTHVLRSGYWFAVEIRKALGEQLDFPKDKIFTTIREYQEELDEMLNFNERLFDDYPDMKLEEFDSEKKITVLWGQTYDPEQLIEHAIVHVLRHRRQIEKFKTKVTRQNQ